jgi:hypothetical protein
MDRQCRQTYRGNISEPPGVDQRLQAQTTTQEIATSTISTLPSPKSSPTVPEPQAVAESEAPKVKRNVVSATLHDRTLVVPSFKRCQQMSAGVGKSFGDILRIISQWRAQTCRDADREQRGMPLLIYALSNNNPAFLEIEIFRKVDGYYEQTVNRYRLHHTPWESDCSYVKADLKPNQFSDGQTLLKWTALVASTFRRGLKNHLGTLDETGSLRTSKQPSIHEAFYDLKKPFKISSTALSVKHKTNHADVRYTPLEPTDNRQPKMKSEKKPEKNSEEVQASSMHDQIASTMKLAGALYEVSIMLNDEIPRTPSHKDDNTFYNIDSDWINEPNPVFKTMKNDEVDVDAVQRKMTELKTRLHDHKDKTLILAGLCRKRKEELEARYPLMKRKSASNSDVHNLMSPVKDKNTDEESKSTSTTVLSNSNGDRQPSKQQDRLSNDRNNKQPRSRSNDGRKYRRKYDDGFSITAL